MIVIHARNDRDADNYVTSTFGQHFQILQDQFILHAGKAKVPFIVHHFQIVEEQIDVLADSAQDIGIGKSAGIKRGSNPLGLTGG